MSDASEVLNFWSALREYIPAKERKDAAEQFVATLSDSTLIDIEASISDLFGTCGVLDKALNDLATELDLCEDVDDYNNDWDE